MQIAITFIVGILFGIGLIISGLANPAKVLNFLDVTGTWDPSLALTMMAAVLVTGLGYAGVFKRQRPILGHAFQLPTVTAIDGKTQDVQRANVGGINHFNAGRNLDGNAKMSEGLARTDVVLVIVNRRRRRQ